MNPNMKTTAFFLTMLLTMLLSGVVSGQQKPTTGYAPVNGLKMYYEIHGSGEPVVLLHGAFMAITDDWTCVDQRTRQNAESDRRRNAGPRADSRHQTRHYLRKPRRRCGRAARLSQDPSADIVGYSLGAGAAMSVRSAIRKKCERSSAFQPRSAATAGSRKRTTFGRISRAEMFKGTPAETEREKLNPVPGSFPDFFNHIKAAAMRPYDFGADNLKATKAPFFFIHGDADGVRLDHIAEMYRLKGGGKIHGDMQPRPESRLAILPDTTHVTLMDRMTTIVPMINDFLDAKPQKQ